MAKRKPRSERGFASFEVSIADRRLIFRTQPGVFSHGAADQGTLLLLRVVQPEVRPHQRILDLGAGAGILGICLAADVPRGEVWLADSDIRAVRLTEENIGLNGLENARAFLSDITMDLPSGKFDLVVSNPPTHSGKEVLEAFINEAFDALRPGGHAYLVVNRLLSAKHMLEGCFGNVETVAHHKGFMVLRSEKQRREKSGGGERSSTGGAHDEAHGERSPRHGSQR
ncbi:MAG: class I SAM-dependent methyltransferase [Chloroflexota bacterium]